MADFMGLMKQAQQLQSKMQELQNELQGQFQRHLHADVAFLLRQLDQRFERADGKRGRGFSAVGLRDRIVRGTRRHRR